MREICPGLDPFEMMVGKSFVETVMGSVYEPEKIFHNSLRWMTGDSQQRKNLWTVDFPDPIVNNPLGYKHRVWLDHILLSPNMLQTNNPVHYVMDSGTIATKDNTSRAASDHFAVHCKIET